jgi:hypothetical protein
MRPTVGAIDSKGCVICPPLCKYHELVDGTYTLADVERFHHVIDELIEVRLKHG